MGCCVSTNDASPPSKKSCISKSPPPSHPLIEEETVKEVLSETPTIPKHLPSPLVPRVQENRQTGSHFMPNLSRGANDKRSQKGIVCNKHSTAFSNDDDLSGEVSEICSSLSESASVSTAVTGNNNNRGRESRDPRKRSPARSKNRSYSGEVKREKTVGRSPGRRPEASPNRVRPGIGSGYGKRRDSGESSGRRSMSPLTRTVPTPSRRGLGRTQSAGKTGKSPGRVGERTRKPEERRESGWPPTSNELLENPLVSLECFIFL